MWEPLIPSCLWLRDFRMVLEPPNQLFVVFGDPRIPKHFERNPEHVQQLFLTNLIFGNRFVWTFWKRRAPKNPGDPSNKFLRILDMGSISSRTWNGVSVNLSNFETKKLWQQETKKPNTNKPIIQEIKKPRSLGTTKTKRNKTKQEPVNPKSRNQETEKPNKPIIQERLKRTNKTKQEPRNPKTINQETKQARKPRNHETTKPRTPYPSTYRLPPL